MKSQKKKKRSKPNKAPMIVSASVRAAAKVARKDGRWQGVYAEARGMFLPAMHPPGVAPSKASSMAMDDNEFLGGCSNWGARNIEASMLLEGQAFLGYSTLSLMAQRTENRAIVGILSTEMTRKWIRLKSKGDDKSPAKADRIAKISDYMNDLNVRDEFRFAAQGDGFFGRGHLFLEFKNGGWGDKDEMKTDIGDGRNNVSRAKCSRTNPLVRVKYVEAVWTYPLNYNTDNPLRPDWFRPTTWQVMGTPIHASRLLRFVLNEVPDMLKPAYSFGGLAMTQMARPYVDYWLKVRSSISDLVRQFTLRVLATNLKTTLQGGTEQSLYDRAELLTDMESNNGVVMIDKDAEEVNQLSAPLGGLHELQAQSQEHLSLPGRIPTVKLSGISPTGLNASSDGELEAFDDTISSMQEALFRDPLRTVIGFVQLSLFDEVDDDIEAEFIPLVEERPLLKAQRRLTEAQYHAAYVEMGAIDASAVRRALANDPDSPYPGLEDDDLAQGTMDDPWVQLAASFRGNDNDSWKELAGAFSRSDSAEKGWKQFLGQDAFEESKHPRGQPENKGEFAPVSGSGTSKTKPENESPRKGMVPLAAGRAIPAHIKALKLPPAWTDVHYATNPKAALQAIGKDSKGRAQYVYSAEHVERQSIAKFARIRELQEKARSIAEQNEENRKSLDERIRQAADCLALIMATGIRPGSETDMGAEKQAHGATTLTREHFKGDRLQFVGKKGVDLDIPLDPRTAKIVAARARKAGKNGNLFPDLSDAVLRDYTHTLDGGGFKVKDFRTLLGSTTAKKLVDKMKAPANAKAYKAQVKQVATEVSKRLGNTPSVALTSYIDPSVWGKWRAAIGE